MHILIQPVWVGPESLHFQQVPSDADVADSRTTGPGSLIL